MVEEGSNPPVPLPGQTINLTESQGSSAAITPATSGSNVTNAAGIATFTVTDTTSEGVRFTATDTTSDPPSVLPEAPIVTFGDPTVPVSATLSTITTTEPLGGQSGQVVVTLLDSYGRPVSGKVVELKISPSTPSTTASIDGYLYLTTSNGRATFTVNDTAAETVSFTAIDGTDSPNIVLVQTGTLVFGSNAPPAATPEVPVVFLLPLAAMGIFGGSVFVTKRRRRKRAGALR
jgi:hypothetical protein